MRIFRRGCVATILLIICVASFGCHAQKFVKDIPSVHPSSAIIFIPGYYGTSLARNTDNSIVWVSASELLFGRQPLTLPIPDLQLTATTDLHATAVLETVPVIPLLYEVDVYGSLLNRLRAVQNRHGLVYPLAYDWRKDLLETVRKLDALILQLHAHGTQHITIVAHSLGGLILSYYLRYGTQDPNTAVETWDGTQRVHSVVMVGVPFQGVMNSFRNMNYGVTATLNTSILTAEAYSSFPSSYFTLPILEGDRLLTISLNTLSPMIRHSQNWQQFGWGLLNEKHRLSPTVIEQRAEYMTFWLDRSRRFLQLLNAPQSHSSLSSPPLLYIYGQGFDTLDHGIFIDKETKSCVCLYFDNDDQAPVIPTIDPDRLYEDGDETVTVRSSALPEAFQHVFQTRVNPFPVNHTELVTNDDIQDVIISFLNNPI